LPYTAQPWVQKVKRLKIVLAFKGEVSFKNHFWQFFVQCGIIPNQGKKALG
jgi:hypothetical protein